MLVCIILPRNSNCWGVDSMSSNYCILSAATNNATCTPVGVGQVRVDSLKPKQLLLSPAVFYSYLNFSQGPWDQSMAVNEFKKQFRAKAGVAWEARVGMVAKKGDR